MKYTFMEKAWPWFIGLGALLLLTWAYLSMVFNGSKNISNPAIGMIAWVAQMLGIFGAPIICVAAVIAIVAFLIKAANEPDKGDAAAHRRYALIAAILFVVFAVYGLLVYFWWLIPK